MMAALFCLFLVELWLNAKTGGHNHGGATGEGFGANKAAPGIQDAFHNPLKRKESIDSQMTMAARVGDEKKGWVDTS
jgi:hypothetical protein